MKVRLNHDEFIEMVALYMDQKFSSYPRTGMETALNWAAMVPDDDGDLGVEFETYERERQKND